MRQIILWWTINRHTHDNFVYLFWRFIDSSDIVFSVLGEKVVIRIVSCLYALLCSLCFRSFPLDIIVFTAFYHIGCVFHVICCTCFWILYIWSYQYFFIHIANQIMYPVSSKQNYFLLVHISEKLLIFEQRYTTVSFIYTKMQNENHKIRNIWSILTTRFYWQCVKTTNILSFLLAFILKFIYLFVCIVHIECSITSHALQFPYYITGTFYYQ